MTPVLAGSAALVACSLAITPALTQEPTVKQVLGRAAAYATAFQEQLSGIVAEETYSQSVYTERPVVWVQQRKLRSDLLLVRLVGADRYVEFRDVFEVDGRSVRDREERLTKLFLNPLPGAAGQLARVADESARYNIGNFTRTMNTPLLAISFLLPAYQPRFTFERRGRDGGDVWVIQYKERNKPTLIRTPQGRDLRAEGRLWINVSTGAVTRTELVIEQARFRAVVGVTYRMDPTLGFLVPSEMTEVYSAAREQRVEGFATYGRFRRFQVKVDETIRPIRQ
jgi:hypothetical protein